MQVAYISLPEHENESYLRQVPVPSGRGLPNIKSKLKGKDTNTIWRMYTYIILKLESSKKSRTNFSDRSNICNGGIHSTSIWPFGTSMANLFGNDSREY